MPRPQFTLKTMLWVMAVVAAFFAGSAWAQHGWARKEADLLTELRLAKDRQEADHRNFLECDADRYHLEKQLKAIKDRQSKNSQGDAR